ncbi:MAG: chemotaxis protein CheX [Actinobacteria bacterium 13_2_20CM_2_71_6]|nr:MAG: chemotaxis protein CheX [Actinobacteria bacterium 13_2_20CM_2_71_6]
MSDQTTPTVDNLREIAEQVWSAYLDPEGIRPLMLGETSEASSGVSASVSLTGAWHGHVVVTCSSEAARNAAAAFLAMETTEVSDEDMTDVMGELANIVGGNVKSMLPAATAVSLPHVVTGAANRFPTTRQICELAGTWLDEPFSISMWQSRELAEVPAA